MSTSHGPGSPSPSSVSGPADATDAAGQAGNRGGPQLDRERAASRLSAYVYGNIIALATLVGLDPKHWDSWRAAVVVTGTGLGTFIAHVFSDLVGHRIRHGRAARMRDIIPDTRDASPILTSTALPVAALIVSKLGFISTSAALWVCFGVIATRFALLGMLIQRWGRRGRTRRGWIAGVGFAAVAIAIATIKAALGH